PRDRAVTLPAVAAQQIEAAVVADAGVGVDGHVVRTLLARAVRERGPGGGRGRVAAYDGSGLSTARQLGVGGVVGKVCRWRPGHQVHVAHAATLSEPDDETRHTTEASEQSRGINPRAEVLTSVMAQQTPTRDSIPPDVRPWPALFALCLGFFMIL